MDGAPNYRRVSLPSGNCVFGIGMPTKSGLQQTLKYIRDQLGGSKRRLIWTCLREEPVIFVNGRPFVLRTFQDPLSNLETTGIVRERVEMMENRMKADILNELSHYNGQLLLHNEEAAGGKGDFSIVPVWEHVKPENVETTLEVFEDLKSAGYDIDYLRIPMYYMEFNITDLS
jgi:hypothetical protein